MYLTTKGQGQWSRSSIASAAFCTDDSFCAYVSQSARCCPGAPAVMPYPSGAATGPSGAATGVPERTFRRFYTQRENFAIGTGVDREDSWRCYWYSQKGLIAVATDVHREDISPLLLLYIEMNFSHSDTGVHSDDLQQLLLVCTGRTVTATAGVHREDLQWLLMVYTEMTFKVAASGVHREELQPLLLVC